MKKTFKFIIALFIIAVILTFNLQVSALSWDSIVGQAQSWLGGGKNGYIGNDSIANAVVPLGQALTAIGVVVLFAALLILGIKYMVADPEKKGQLKQQLIGVVVSGVVIFGAYTIWRICYNFFADTL